MRCFLAVDLPMALRRAVHGRARALLGADPGIRWQRAETLHLTLRFLGEIAPDVVSTLEERLAPLARSTPAFELAVDGLGLFGTPRRPRVLWLGVKGDLPALVRLAEGVEGMVRACGLPPADHPFRPHLTLARLRRGATAAGPIAKMTEDWPPFAVAGMTLYASSLHPEGARHEALASFPFDGGT